MIARMVKIEIVGPSELLLEVLSLLRDLELFQIEQDITGFVAAEDRDKVRPLLLDEKTMAERIYCEDLRARIDELFACLPREEMRQSYLDPGDVLESVNETLQRHSALCREWCRKREELRTELAELGGYSVFLGALEPHVTTIAPDSGLDFIGVTIREPAAVAELMRTLARLTGGRFQLLTVKAEDGTLIGLITLEKDLAAKVRGILGEQHVPEMTFPPELARMPFPEKIRHLRTRTAEVTAGIAAIDEELARFARRWGAIYARVRSWLDERLALLGNTAHLHRTGMCFFIHGWTPAADVPRLTGEIRTKFGGAVLVEEKQILEQDLDLVPVTLRNPPLFRPFELFARLLPLPRYASFDPTPFIAVCFPLFFGMILGDAGYGLVLLILALILGRVFRQRETARDAARILLFSSCYTILFGILYGEFFGEVGAGLLGMKEGFIVERRQAIVPMLCFALSVGLAHILLGLLLGFITALRRKTGREAMFKLVNILAILCLVVLVLSRMEIVPRLLTRPLALILIFLIPFLFFSGGVLAPLELLKSIGNIVSYARIMAIGLASLLLARVANRFAGMTGNVVTGVLLAVIFHAVNIVLGVFSPTIHALRLHYVEFYSKFMVPGGRKFEPLRKG
ncbi:V-type ATP synthase subunit I [Geobacter anodireducens]|uniref:ATPase n=1 Tax=Geobacter anodireducens TaxID=1340425 RepID=A0ABR9NTD6_9BACT|nr:V-type ATPase 116kDa subunit family protein [Geobacter anodireducens]MBE2887531.1 ATPase [Geobacter anodireducens]